MSCHICNVHTCCRCTIKMPQIHRHWFLQLMRQRCEATCLGFCSCSASGLQAADSVSMQYSSTHIKQVAAKCSLCQCLVSWRGKDINLCTLDENQHLNSGDAADLNMELLTLSWTFTTCHLSKLKSFATAVFRSNTSGNCIFLLYIK